MVEFLARYQLNIMLALSSACGVIALFVLLTKALSKSRKRALLLLELSSMFLLYFDRLAYMFSGNTTQLGFIMVRLTNFIVFSMTLVVSLALNLYLIDLLKEDGGLKKPPVRLSIVNLLCTLGIAMIVISQFTGFYYYFDAQNKYRRGSGFLLCYLIPMIVSLLQLSIIIQYVKQLNRKIAVALFLFILLPLVASAVQIKAYGLSLTNISIVGVSIFLYIVALFDINDKMARAKQLEMDYLREESNRMQRLFDQTATSFVNAVDIKDIYTTGHSARVADYAKEIAKKAGKDEDVCRKVYYAALLHDVGKIGIPDRILQNDGRLNEEEYEIWKKRSEIGNEILSQITEYPYLKDGAHYVHERYDGSGYPEGLRGEEIPEIARIVAVADYYDALTSKKSYRDIYPQPFVREVFVKGAGTLFDPEYAQIMLDLIDADANYSMRAESDESAENEGNELDVAEYRSAVYKGVALERTVTKIKYTCQLKEDAPEGFAQPSLIIFDAYDGHVHDNSRTINAFQYLEYAEVWFDGHAICTNARSVKCNVLDHPSGHPSGGAEKPSTFPVEITMGRYEDHARILIQAGEETTEVIIAFPDSSKYAYVGLTGEYCILRDIEIEKTERKIKAEEINRIAPKQVYTNRMQGDLPNLQIDRRRLCSTDGMQVLDGMRIYFHTMSLPSANLIWHCPYIVLYTSDDAKIEGKNYNELALIKLNGENEGSNENCENKILVKKTDEFIDWDTWKERNKEGVDCEVYLEKTGNKIVVNAEIAGLSVRNITVVKNMPAAVYIALTGDRCALTTIRIK